MRKMTVLGASALLVAGLMASPAAAFAAPALVESAHQGGDLRSISVIEPAGPADDDVAPSVGDEAEELAETGTSSAIGFALIAVALIGGGVTLTVLRRQGALES